MDIYFTYLFWLYYINTLLPLKLKPLNLCGCVRRHTVGEGSRGDGGEEDGEKKEKKEGEQEKYEKKVEIFRERSGESYFLAMNTRNFKLGLGMTQICGSGPSNE